MIKDSEDIRSTPSTNLEYTKYDQSKNPHKTGFLIDIQERSFYIVV